MKLSKSTTKSNRLHNRAGSAVKAVLALCICMALCGCGKKADNLKTAYEALSIMDYDAALAALSNAEEAGEDAREIARARGIAYMGKADYVSASAQFVTSLHSGTGSIKGHIGIVKEEI